MLPRKHGIAIYCILLGIALAACGPGGTPAASIIPTGQVAVPSMPQSVPATTTPIPTSTPRLDTVAAPTVTLTPTPAPTELSHPALLRTLNGNFIEMAFSPDGRTLATAEETYTFGQTGPVRLWDTATGEIRSTLEESVFLGVGQIGGEFITSDPFRWSPDGSKLAAISLGSVIVWDIATGRRLQMMEVDPRGLLGVAWSANHLLAVSDPLIDWNVDSLMSVWEVETGQKLHTLKHDSWYNSIAWSPYGAMMVTGRKNGFDLWNPISGTLMRKFRPFSNSPLSCAAFSPDGSKLVSVAGAGGPVVAWDVMSGEELYVLSGLSGRVSNISFSPNGSMFVTGVMRGCNLVGDPSCVDDHVFGDIILWDAETGAYLNAIKDLSSEVHDVAWSPAGDVIAALSERWDRDPNYTAITLWSVQAILSDPPPPMSTPFPTTTPELRPDGKVEVEVYFTRKPESSDPNDYVAVKRIVEPTASLPETVLREYFKGPSQEDRAVYGITEAASYFAGFSLLRIEDGIAYVHLQPAWDWYCPEYGAGDDIRINLLQFTEIRGVSLLISNGDGLVDSIFVGCPP